MLRELLSKLKFLQKNPHQNEESQLNLSPNLLNSSFSNTSFVTSSDFKFGKYTTASILTLKLLILVPFILSIGLIAVNFYLDTKISALVIDTNILALDVFKKESLRKDIVELQSKTAVYKQIIFSRTLLKDKALIITSSIPENIKLTHLALRAQDASLSLKADNALEFVILLDTLLKNPNVKEIELRSASLSLDQQFLVDIGVVFK